MQETTDFSSGITTNELARQLGIQTQAIYQAMSRKGHYHRLIPGKRADGRLFWPADAAQRIRAVARQWRQTEAA